MTVVTDGRYLLLIMYLKKLLSFRRPPPSQEQWEARYRRGYAGNASDAREMGHFALVAAYIRVALAPQPRIVDVGCGRGQLLDQLCAGSLGAYYGFDLSETAIADARVRAVKLGLDPTRVSVAGFDDWVAPGVIDAVVFCESLSYAPDPVSTLRRYISLLGENGIAVVSLYRNQQAVSIGRRLEKSFRLLDSTSVVRAEGKRWDVRLIAQP